MKKALALLALILLPGAAYAFSGYFVYFDRDSAELPHSQDGLTLLKGAAQAYQSHKAEGREVGLLVHGHIDPSEVDLGELSLRRARVVRAALIQSGVPAEAIKAIGLGTERLSLPAGNPENRHVRIEVCVPPKNCDNF